MLERVLIIGDIHCQDQSLERVLAYAIAEGYAPLCVGDLVDGPSGDADRCCDLLVEHKVPTVRGNHERWLLADEMRSLPEITTAVSAGTQAFLEALPTLMEFETPMGRLMLCHALGEDDMAELKPDTKGYGLQAALAPIRDRTDVRFVACGHTHRVMVRKVMTWVILNGGTLHPKHGPVFLCADFVKGNAEIFDLAPDGCTGRGSVEI